MTVEVDCLAEDEAVAATHRLCGFRIERRDVLPAALLHTAERAWVDLWYWIPAETG
jgi:hypothetical protein